MYKSLLVPVHPLPSSLAVLYHVNDQLQRLRGHCYLYHTDISAIRHYSVGIKQFSWNVSLLRRGLFMRLGKGKKKARVRGGRWEGQIAVCGSERC